MTTTPLRPPRPRAPSAPDGALLVLRLDDPRWAERLPPVPQGRTVTVAFSCEAAAGEHADALAPLGYTVVGVSGPGAPAEEATASIHVPEEVLRAHPMWWRALAESADRAYNLASGPALRLLGRILQVHLGTG